MIPLLSVEFFKLRKRMMTWLIALILVGLVILVYSVLWNISGRVTTFGDHHRFTSEQLRTALFLQTSVPFALQMVGSLGIILAIVLAAGAAGSEYSWGTVRLMATASSGRLRYLTAKLVIVFALVVLGILLAVATALLYSSLITFTNSGFGFGFVTGPYLRDQLESLGRTLSVITPYVCLAFGAAVVGRSTLAGAGAGIGAAFAEPLIASLMRLGGEPWHSIPRYFMNANAQVILQQNDLPAVLPRFTPGGEDLHGINSVEEAFLILSVYSVVFVALALFAYRRRDITAG